MRCRATDVVNDCWKVHPERLLAVAEVEVIEVIEEAPVRIGRLIEHSIPNEATASAISRRRFRLFRVISGAVSLRWSRLMNASTSAGECSRRSKAGYFNSGGM